MPAEHWTPTGLAQGYYCLRCGKSSNMYGSGHGDGLCQPNPEYVNRLKELNTEEMEGKRKFLKGLQHGN